MTRVGVLAFVLFAGLAAAQLPDTLNWILTEGDPSSSTSTAYGEWYGCGAALADSNDLIIFDSRTPEYQADGSGPSIVVHGLNNVGNVVFDHSDVDLSNNPYIVIPVIYRLGADGSIKWARELVADANSYGQSYISVYSYNSHMASIGNGDFGISGYTSSSADFGNGCQVAAPSNYNYYFVASFSGADGSCKWATNTNVWTYGLAFDATEGAMFVTTLAYYWYSQYYGTSLTFLDYTLDTPTEASIMSAYSYILKVDASGSVVWGRHDSGNGYAYGLSIDTSSNVYAQVYAYSQVSDTYTEQWDGQQSPFWRPDTDTSSSLYYYTGAVVGYTTDGDFFFFSQFHSDLTDSSSSSSYLSSYYDSYAIVNYVWPGDEAVYINVYWVGTLHHKGQDFACNWDNTDYYYYWYCNDVFVVAKDDRSTAARAGLSVYTDGSSNYYYVWLTALSVLSNGDFVAIGEGAATFGDYTVGPTTDQYGNIVNYYPFWMAYWSYENQAWAAAEAIAWDGYYNNGFYAWTQSTIVDSLGNFYAVGRFEGSGNFLGTTITSVGPYDLFIAQFGGLTIGVNYPSTVNPCQGTLNPCVEGTCNNNNGQAECICSSGWTGANCDQDVDECAQGNGGCDPQSTCTNTPGSFSCGSCPDGFTGDGYSGCADIDECADGTDGCDVHVECDNTPGSYSCGACPSGFSGDGSTAGGCVAIDFCASNNGDCDTNTECDNTAGSRTCGDCPSGFSGNGYTGCDDVDECSVGNGGCDPLTACTNTAGGYSCGSCPDGYTGNGWNGCYNLDSCDDNNGGCDPTVSCSGGGHDSIVCGSCGDGYTGDGYSGCYDVNECEDNNGGCADGVDCINFAGGSSCRDCPDGFYGDGHVCNDANECSVNNGGCDDLTTCTNTQGSRTCGDCPGRQYIGDGYRGCQLRQWSTAHIHERVTPAPENGAINELFCPIAGQIISAIDNAEYGCFDTLDLADVSNAYDTCLWASSCDVDTDFSSSDSCETSADRELDVTYDCEFNRCDVQNGFCDTLTTCTSLHNVVTCGDCPDGYWGSGADGCNDINECDDDNNGGCDPVSECSNSDGSHSCAPCPSGYEDVNGDGTYCLDVNECDDGNNGGCDTNTECVNVPGSYYCTDCPEGWTGTGLTGCSNQHCETGNGGCDPLTTCSENNHVNGVTCSVCPPGYESDSGTGSTPCDDIDECADNNGWCDPLTTCTNSVGSYTCGDCPAGYTGSGYSHCEDIDECAEDNGGCDSLTACINSPGSYDCGSCPFHYTGTGHTGCHAINSCDTNNGGCDELTTCVDLGTGGQCGNCPAGYDGNGYIGCTDHNECDDLSNGGCDELTQCVNTVGSYYCTECPDGYFGTGETHCFQSAVRMDVTITYDQLHGNVVLTCPFGDMYISEVFTSSYGCDDGTGTDSDVTDEVSSACENEANCAFDGSSFGDAGCDDGTKGQLQVHYECNYNQAPTSFYTAVSRFEKDGDLISALNAEAKKTATMSSSTHKVSGAASTASTSTTVAADGASSGAIAGAVLGAVGLVAVAAYCGFRYAKHASGYEPINTV